MSYPNTLPYPQIGGPVGGIAPKASSLTSTPAYLPGNRFYTGGPGAQSPGMLVVTGSFLDFILGNTYTFVVFSLKAPQVPQPTPPSLPNILAEEAILVRGGGDRLEWT